MRELLRFSKKDGRMSWAKVVVSDAMKVMVMDESRTMTNGKDRWT